MNPKDLLYAETHEWVRVAPDGRPQGGHVGHHGFRLEQLTDLVHMVCPKSATRSKPARLSAKSNRSKRSAICTARSMAK
jgi:glycine cleavage system H lipoate-binding protein